MEHDKEVNTLLMDVSKRLDSLYEKLVGSDLYPSGMIREVDEIKKEVRELKEYQQSQTTAIKILGGLVVFIGLAGLVKIVMKFMS